LEGSFLRENPAAAAGVGIATAVVMVGLGKLLGKKSSQQGVGIRQLERDLKHLQRSLTTTLASRKQLNGSTLNSCKRPRIGWSEPKGFSSSP
jgi:hypothetical protein